MIIGFVGFIGSGKDTAADYLVNFHGFRRDSFANTLKDAVAQCIWLGQNTPVRRPYQQKLSEWREQVDPWWAERLNMPSLTPRWVLQYWGTEVCRQGFHDDIWIASVENKMRKTTDNIVISDVRFPNEIRAIHNAGGIVVRVQRGVMPHWYDVAIQANKGVESAQNFLKKEGIHASETAWVGGKIDHVLCNDSSIDDLYNQIKNLVEDRLVST
jgi:hypothetical protein